MWWRVRRGEADDLRGEPVDGDIRITCLSCDAQWIRGGVRCANCGGQDIVHRPQAMTRHSRGTQLSVIGWRELPLCRSCDAEALDTSISQNAPVPSDYVAACLGAARSSAAAAPQASPPALAATPKPAPAAAVKPAAVAKSSPPPRAAARPRQARTKAEPSPSMAPTVRQAIAAFMSESSGQADATAMLLLGTHLGSHNRLTVLEEDGAADRLAQWRTGLVGPHAPARLRDRIPTPPDRSVPSVQGVRMLSSTSPPDAGSAPDGPETERLLATAVRLARTLPAAHPTLAVVRGWGRGDRERARLLCARLAEQGIRSTELSPVPEAGERGGQDRGPRRPAVDLLVHAGGPQEQAMRAAALWQLPLLIDRPAGRPGGELNAFGAHRSPVIGIHLSDGGVGVGVRETVLVSLQPQPGNARLILDNEKITAPGDQPLRIILTGQGLLEARGDSFGRRRIRRLRFERAWGAYRMDVDGAPARDVRAPLRIETLPGRLHLLHP